jgi:hypothetical protein
MTDDFVCLFLDRDGTVRETEMLQASVVSEARRRALQKLKGSPADLASFEIWAGGRRVISGNRDVPS